MAFEDDDDRRYVVLINHEEQYSLWPREKTVPEGWTACGFEGTKAECSAYVDKTWTDMRPKSLREALPVGS